MTIIITGTSAGIGFTLAEYLGKKGHTVFGLSRKNVESNYFKTIPTDITDHAQVQNAIAEVLKTESRIDILINNAGMGMVGPVEDSSQAEILQLFNLNLVGTVQMMTAVLPIMRAQKMGRIINVSSIGSEMGLPFRGFYSASKAAVDKVTEAIRYEVSPWNIQVCALHLGDIKTKIAENRVKTKISEPYQKIFDKVYGLMNAHVDHGNEPLEVAEYIEKLLEKRQWKAHFYYAKLGQRIGVPLKWMLPQNFYENLMRRYNQLD
ncbi:SDR family oxidoreductase [Kaistella antarctica]|uniref:Cyclopentanol dehydrogenase n=1 Tax=Kaistella antarctica TaxID=266748 RepID=A0A448NRU5_9FLAO|nr:SDR family oxidoreductase [Kaistella antarctica]KEY18667.1 short-chain dehydrogenase [Kaistella antarctica]SEW16858.1 Short-chain dehydrogenase [Kaistella antarctica]VEH99745.1 Cyclopentanol dehydrogenase [Kaistella antarctica]